MTFRCPSRRGAGKEILSTSDDLGLAGRGALANGTTQGIGLECWLRPRSPNLRPVHGRGRAVGSGFQMNAGDSSIHQYAVKTDTGYTAGKRGKQGRLLCAYLVNVALRNDASAGTGSKSSEAAV
jgi:hypothetical protein